MATAEEKRKAKLKKLASTNTPFVRDPDVKDYTKYDPLGELGNMGEAWYANRAKSPEWIAKEKAELAEEKMFKARAKKKKEKEKYNKTLRNRPKEGYFQ